MRALLAISVTWSTFREDSVFVLLVGSSRTNTFMIPVNFFTYLTLLVTNIRLNLRENVNTLTLKSLHEWATILNALLQKSRNSIFSGTCNKTVIIFLGSLWLVTTVAAVLIVNYDIRVALFQRIIVLITNANSTRNDFFSTFTISSDRTI